MSELTVTTEVVTPSDSRIRMLQLLQRVHTYAFATKSNYAREWADEVAAASSLGYISVVVVPGGSLPGRLWKITLEGLIYLTELADLIEPLEVEAYLGEAR